MDHVFDIAIIGGGINGCGCAADAALRGLSIVLFEQDDLASKTSSSSTKLIHGGLRYLEYYEFGLVKKALQERQTLLNMAPHLVHPQSFVLPYQKHMRSPWFLRLGLFLYDHLSLRNRLPKCKSINKARENSFFDPLDDEMSSGFLFYDGSTDDARLTISNALQAKKYGASIRPRSKVIKAEAIDGLWELTIQPQTGAAYQAQAKLLINATGPWVSTISQITKTPLKHNMALIKGSHIVVPKMYEGDHAYFLQHEDNRVVFVIPYHGHSMIGTTDVPYSGALENISISDDEIDYLINLVNKNFKIKIHAKDLIYSWSGVRPLLASENKSASSLSRDYSYELTLTPAPMVTILGGKITTYRQLGQEIINQLSVFFPKMGSSVTSITPLPGATLEAMRFEEYVVYAQKRYHWINPDLLKRYLFSYGTNTEFILAGCNNINSMGKNYGCELYQVELDYLISEEWAHTCDDILVRRTKLGLIMDDTSKNEIEEYLASKLKKS